MSPRALPDRPDLEFLKKQAKALLRDAERGEAAALERFAILPAYAGQNAAQLARAGLALHDAQSVIAREHGFASWNALRDELEARVMDPEAAVDAFVRAATGGALAKAERLLARHPAIGRATLQAALVRGDVDEVGRRLRAEPRLATTPGGPQQWAPLLYVCHTCLAKGTLARKDDLVAIARDLLARGADPNGEYHWNWHPELPRTVLWASLCEIDHRPLAELLLEAGADPTDGVSSHIIAGVGNLAALDLLFRFGLKVDGRPGGVPPLAYLLTWARRADGARWLLDHGADPNLGWGDDGEVPLHLAARRWDVSLVEAIVAHGADVNRRRRDGATPHTVAELFGHHDIGVWLLAHGATDELSPLDRFVSACARADAATAAAMLRERPQLRLDLRPEHHVMTHRPAEEGRADVLDVMLRSGFSPAATDKDRVTPLHRAAMGGHPEAVRVLLEHGAPVDAQDGMFAAPPLVWAVEGQRTGNHDEARFVDVARLLIDAGSPVDWTPPPGAPGVESTLEDLIELRRAAARRARVG